MHFLKKGSQISHIHNFVSTFENALLGTKITWRDYFEQVERIAFNIDGNNFCFCISCLWK